MATLYYFPLFGRGEIIRQFFHFNKIEFTDEVIDFVDWPKMK
jgi:hypothetical protein